MFCSFRSLLIVAFLASIVPIHGMTINASGDQLLLNSGSQWLEVLNSPSNYGQVTINNGGVTIMDNVTMNLIFNYTPSYGQISNVIVADLGINGQFNSIDNPDSATRIRIMLTGNGTIANLVCGPLSYTLVAQNPNQTNVATALNSFISATSGDELTVSTALDSLTASEYPAVFNQIMPTLYQSLSTIAFNSDNAQNQELVQRLWALRMTEPNEDGDINFSSSGFGDNIPYLETQEQERLAHHHNSTLHSPLDSRWNLFTDGNGIFAQANSGNTLPTYNIESGGVTAGLAYRWNKQLTTGVYNGYEGSYTKFNGGSSLVDNGVRFGLFGTYGQKYTSIGEGWFLNGVVGGVYHNYTMCRDISFSDINRTAIGTPTAGELNTMLATGYDTKKGDWTFGPLSSLQYLYFGVPSFNETGADSLDLNTSGWNSSSMIYSLGGHLAYHWQTSKSVTVTPQLSLSWQHEFLQNPYSINSTLGSGTSPVFVNWSSAPLRDTLYTGVGFTVDFAKRWNSSFFYNAAAGNVDMVSQNIFWSIGMKF